MAASKPVFPQPITNHAFSRKRLEELWHEQVEYAEGRYGPFTSTHEGYGVLAEEMAELLDAIRANSVQATRKEAIQCAAVAFRLAMSLDNEATRDRSHP